jgi:hypothetical protein
MNRRKKFSCRVLRQGRKKFSVCVNGAVVVRGHRHVGPPGGHRLVCFSRFAFGSCVEIEGLSLPIDLSAGWAELLSGESARDLLARADAELYANKRAKSTGQLQPVAV